MATAYQQEYATDGKRWVKRVAAPMSQGSLNPKQDLAGSICWFGLERLLQRARRAVW